MRLVEVAKRHGARDSMLVQRAADIDWRRIGDAATIGMSAGASAPEIVVEEIIDAIQAETAKSRSDILVSEVFGALDVVRWCEENAAKALADEKVPTPLTMMGKKSFIAYGDPGARPAGAGRARVGSV